MASNYQEKKQARINRYRELAEKNHAAASAKREESREMMSAIPMGQPILIGHHSEKRDRNFREKAWNKLGQAVALSEKAEYYEHKAQAAENNHAISSDDPEAIKLLKEKLEKLEKLQNIMKAANKIVRSKKLTDEEKIQEMVKLGLSEEGAANALKPDFCGRVGFASYSLQNNNANIKRVKDRIKELEKRANDETTEEEINGIRIVDNVEDNRLQVFFEGIPAAEIRSKLKSNGFRWSRYNGCWQSYRSERAKRIAQQVAQKVGE